MWEYVYSAAKLIVAVFSANLVLRSSVFFLLRHFGAFDPRFDYYWPRLPWRPFFRAYAFFCEWWEENFSAGKKNTEGFSSFLACLSAQLKPNTILIGRVRLPYLGGWYQAVGQSVSRHIFLIASTRSGKSVFLAILIALLPKNATAFIIDPKGFFSRVILTALKALSRAVHVVDPLAITGWRSSSINLLAQIAELSRRIGQDVSTIMFDSFAATDIPANQSNNPFFPLTAAMLWAGIIAHVASTFANGSMINARRLLSKGYIEQADDDAKLAMQMLWQAMAENPSWNGYVSNVGLQMLEMPDRERGSVLATARSHTKYLDHEQIMAVSQRNDFFLTDLKREDSDLIFALALPTTEIRTTFQPYVAQLTAFTLKSFELIEGNLSERCRFVLEELPSYGPKIAGLAESFPLLGGYGAMVIAVAQDLFQLLKSFPNEAKSMLGNADFIFYMGVNEQTTEEYLSAHVLGEKTHKKKQKSGDIREVERRVMTAGQVRRFLDPKRGNMIVQRAGKRPMRVKLPLYWQELPVWLYHPDKEFGENPSRAAFRKFYPHLLAIGRKCFGFKKPVSPQRDQSKLYAQKLILQSKQSMKEAA